MLRSFGCALTLLAVTCSFAGADTIAYLSAGAAPPGNLELDLPNSAIGTTGFFDIYIRSNELVAGASLNLIATGDSINLTGATIPQYSPRWASAQNGVLSVDNKSIVGMDAFAIPGFGSNGLNPATANTDAGYNAGANAFHYGTVNYSVLGAGETTFKFVIGDIEFGVEGPIFLGTGDAAAALTGAGSAGATSALIDGRIVVQGVPGDTEDPIIAAISSLNVVWPNVISSLQLAATDNISPVDALVWSNLTVTGPGKNTDFSGQDDPSLNADGVFNWDPTGWRGGQYLFSATVADEAGNTSTALALTVQYTVPEPATLSLFGLALLGFVGFARKK